MRLRLADPTHVVIDQDVSKINAESEDGCFCLLPRHADFVSALVPGLLSYTRPDDEEEVFLAVDEGLLVKQGDCVFVSTRQAIQGGELHTLRQRVQDQFKTLDEQQRAYQSAAASLGSKFPTSFFWT